MHLFRLVLALLPIVVSAQTQPEQIEIHAPYVSSPEQVVETMLKLAAVKKGDVVYDLGCGDGRIVIAAAKKFGARGVGIDHNPDLIEIAKASARNEGVESLVRFRAERYF